jgi:hypothetical protein
MKKKRTGFLLTMLLVSFGSAVVAQGKASGPLRFSGGIMTGYNRGFGVQANLTAYNFPPDFPFQLRFGIGYTVLNPGNAADARRIFINNATNGVPEKKGGSFDFRLDFVLPKSVLNMSHSYLVFGPRFSTFRGNFNYVDGNEVFDVISHQWGIGGGIENHFKLSQNVALFLNYGIDFYFPSTLTGHDTSYSPGNDNVNPENDNRNNDLPFVYKDANKAIKQPMFMPRVMLGINFTL